jgi:non-ribosomal peptide synthetase component E (peptide arylation enzyme)
LCIRDRVQVTDTGRWLYKGRLDLLMNRGGAKFSLEAIERTLHERLGIHTLACSLRDTRLGEDLGLVIQAAEESAVLRSAQDVLKNVYSLKLQNERTRFVDELPLNECAKPDRKSLWTLFNEESTIQQ